MRNFIMSSLILVACSLSGVSASAAEKLTPKMDKCKITFVGGKPDGSTHEGGFKKFKIDAQADFEEPANSKINIEIDTESLFADDPKLEAHLKNADFFDVRKYPKATFTSTKIEASETEAMLVGQLTLLGKTAEVKIPLAVEHSEGVVNLSGKFKLDRSKWGMNYGMEGNKINKDVDVAVALEFTH
jgi:polyisoprenoid-binding protein YceI